MGQVINARRHCLLKARQTQREGRLALTLAWNTKRKALIGTDLPSDIPHRTQLIAAWYLVLEEVQGADELELMGHGLSPTAAASVVTYVTDYFESL